MTTMELTPPPSLVRSPASPTHTYCPSERSSLDYPSPGLVDQQYKLSSIYGDQSCAVSPPMEPDSSLPPLDSMAQHEWNALHPTSSASVMPSILSPEYDSFGSYSYSHDAYHQSPNQPSVIHAPTPPPTSSAPRSPVAPPRTTMPAYTSATSIPPLTPRIKMEGGPEYNQTIEAAQYPSPRSAQTPSYPSENGPYAGSSTSGYLSDGTANTASWSKPEYQPLETDHLYPPPPVLQPTPFLQDVKRFRVQRPRRQQRRLTTKEEANFICEFKGCGKMFSRSYNYKAHLETHDEKREYPFPCQVPDCNKRFVRKTDLQRHHASVHLRERTHKCDYCGRMFARKDTLRRHMEDGCSKRFDIGTLDIRPDGAASFESLRPLGPPPPHTPLGHMIPPPHTPGTLPPIGIPPPPLLSSMPPALRPRDPQTTLSHLTETHSGHSWGR